MLLDVLLAPIAILFHALANMIEGILDLFPVLLVLHSFLDLFNHLLTHQALRRPNFRRLAFHWLAVHGVVGDFIRFDVA
uniref:Uncharacterized protein n=1 Tax=Anopheles darlingi TaxID=43151 RepID=A0A2M4D9A9_ANODA